MRVFPTLPFPCQLKNEYGNLRFWIHTSPCEQGIILFDIDQLDSAGKVIDSRYLKLLPENTRNQVYFGKERVIEKIPDGTICSMEVTSGTTGEELSVLIRITYTDETEHTVTWITD
jgi:hypothetical protein